jgi:hypothetical protein
LSLSLALIPLSGQVRISVVEMQRDLKTTWPGTPSALEFRREQGILTFSFGKAFVAIALMPGPIAWQDLEERCNRSWLWPDAEKTLKRHSQHFVLTLESELAPRERAILLTKVCASALVNCNAALGVVYGEAGILARKDIFRDMAAESLRTSLPTELWVECTVAKDGDDKSQGFTKGLAALGHPELEAKGLPMTPLRLHSRLTGVARYLVEHGPIIQEGDAIGESAEERIRVAFGHSAFGNKGTVMRLVYDAP